MAQINIETKVTAPSQITVPLVRADHHQTANIFRTAFEIFLTVSSVLVGHILSLQRSTMVHWMFLLVSVVATIAFLVCSIVFSRRSRDV